MKIIVVADDLLEFLQGKILTGDLILYQEGKRLQQPADIMHILKQWYPLLQRLAIFTEFGEIEIDVGPKRELTPFLSLGPKRDLTPYLSLA